jgi:hypothetical protein
MIPHVSRLPGLPLGGPSPWPCCHPPPSSAHARNRYLSASRAFLSLSDELTKTATPMAVPTSTATATPIMMSRFLRHCRIASADSNRDSGSCSRVNMCGGPSLSTSVSAFDVFESCRLSSAGGTSNSGTWSDEFVDSADGCAFTVAEEAFGRVAWITGESSVSLAD